MGICYGVFTNQSNWCSGDWWHGALVKGLIQVYTGKGKGKTTAVVGLACRARGHNLKICYISFFKDSERRQHGEYKILRKLGIKLYAFAVKHPRFHKEVVKKNVRKECLSGLKFIKTLYKKSEYDILILDEILIAVRDGFIKGGEILEILKSKPEHMELVLTGRGASQEIIQKADLVSDIKKVKHPLDLGIRARKGIEY